MAEHAGATERQVRVSLHNHTTWSDGQYTPDLLAQNAVLNGLTHLGISDHFYTTKVSVPECYVDVDEIDDYIADLHRVADEFERWIQVLAGLEVDWSPRAREKFPELWAKVNQLDYVLFEYVQDAGWHGDSLEALLDVLPHIHIPAGLAHNDLARNFSEQYTPEHLAQLLEESGLFVELPTRSGTEYYRRDDPYTVRLWELLFEGGVRFSVGADTHRFIDDVARIDDAHHFLAERGLLDRLITASWDPDKRTWDDTW